MRHDSDALFRTITQDNPYVGEVKAAFFNAAGQVERSLAQPDAEVLAAATDQARRTPQNSGLVQ